MFNNSKIKKQTVNTALQHADELILFYIYQNSKSKKLKSKFIFK